MTTQYTWRDCETVLDALDDEPREIPALKDAAKRYSEMVKSDVTDKVFVEKNQ